MKLALLFLLAPFYSHAIDHAYPCNVSELPISLSPDWYALGPGLNGTLRTIEISGSGVYAGGDFLDTGGHPDADYLARWDGCAWHAVSAGLNGTVNAVGVHGNDIFVGGNFTLPFPYLAKWNGVEWSAVGTPPSGPVYSIIVDSSYLYIGGGQPVTSGYVSRWDGNAWTNLGPSLNGVVYDLIVHEGGLYMGGQFTNVENNPDLDGIARWDGNAWQNLGTGIQVGAYGFVYSLVSFENDLYVGGPFVNVGGNGLADYVVRWDGTQWHDLGGGPNGFLGFYAICEYQGDIYATVGAGWASDDGIYRFDLHTQSWDLFQLMSLGADDPLLTIAASQSNLYVGGYGFDINGEDFNYIARRGEPGGDINIVDVPDELCQTDFPVSLPTTQSGFTGNWAGPGVTNNIFDPLGLDGDVTITFYLDGNECVDSVNHTIEVSICYTPPPIDWIWAKAISGDFSREGLGVPVVYAVATDTAKAAYTVGYFYGEVDFDPGGAEFLITSTGVIDGFICKLNNEGEFSWAKRIGGEGSGVIIYAIDLKEDGSVYLTGSFSYIVDFDPGPDTHYVFAEGESDIFILKLNSIGEFQWVKNIGGALGGCEGTHITIERNTGNIYTTGTFIGHVDFDPGTGSFFMGSSSAGYNIFISKLDSLGNFLWAKEIPGPTVWSFTSGTSLEIDQASGNVYTTGHFYGTCDFDPGPNTHLLVSNGDADVFLLKLDSNGNFIWARRFGGASRDYCPAVALGRPGNENVYISGGFSGTVDFDPGPGYFNLSSLDELFICKLDSAGHFIWAESLGGARGLTGFTGSYLCVDTLRNESVSIAGGFDGIVDFDPGPHEYIRSSEGLADVFVTKIDSSGNFIWAKTAGGDLSDFSVSLALQEDGKILTTGIYESPSLSFDGTTLSNTNDPNVFVAKLGGCNTVVTSANDNGAGTLRDVVQCAQSGDLITFSLPSMSQITLTSGEIIINKDLTLLGPGAAELAISGNNNSRIFNLTLGTNLHLEGLALQDATAITNGGAILTKGNLTMRNMLVQHNFQNNTPKAITLSFPGQLNIKGTVEIKY